MIYPRKTQDERSTPIIPASQPLALPPTLTDLRLGGPDDAGYMILDIFARKLPEYVVYRNKQRVAVQYADLSSDAAVQRKMMATLNPLRGEINGLIDGWRAEKIQSGPQRRSDRFDRRVADALIVALEGDAATAKGLLAQVKQDILDERTARARFLYLLVAFAAGIAGALVAYSVLHLGNFPPVATELYLAARGGLIGAFFSIALAIRGRTVLPDLQWIANAMDAGLRMLIGLIGAGVLVAMVDAHMVNVKFGFPDDSRVGSTSQISEAQARDQNWLTVLIFGFIAGFSERFVPDLLAKASASAPAPDPAPKAPTGEGNALAAKKPDDATSTDPTDQKRDDPPSDDEAHDDNCACETPLNEAEATADEHLPAASGGVAIPNAA